nr:aluminum-activated malate transporter 10 [Quercus suber]
MASEKEVSIGVEWRIKIADGSSERLVPEANPASRILLGLKSFVVRLALKVWKFLQKAWDLGVDDPRKVIHCLKVGTALAVVSLFYYMRALYEGFGKNAVMWAIMTVVVVFENSVASAATFSRFIPSVKARFDYGAMIFILTFSLVSVSGYRVDELFEMAHHRISTIIIGTSLCIIISMLICPIWAGQELYTLTTRNMDKLTTSLDGCVEEYFKDSGSVVESNKECHKKLQGYKCVLISKAAEESMANFARWEPGHGPFNFRHPWQQYLKIGSSMRSCAYCLEALNGCINSENQAPEYIKKHLNNSSLKVSSNSSSVIRELAITIKTMKKSSNIHSLVGEMNSAVQELQNDLKSLPKLFNPPSMPEADTPENKKIEPISRTMVKMPLMEIVPLLTLASLLIEIATRISGIVDAVEELENLAEFKHASNDKC